VNDKPLSVHAGTDNEGTAITVARGEIQFIPKVVERNFSTRLYLDDVERICEMIAVAFPGEAIGITSTAKELDDTCVIPRVSLLPKLPAPYLSAMKIETSKITIDIGANGINIKSAGDSTSRGVLHRIEDLLVTRTRVARATIVAAILFFISSVIAPISIGLIKVEDNKISVGDASALLCLVGVGAAVIVWAGRAHSGVVLKRRSDISNWWTRERDKVKTNLLVGAICLILGAVLARIFGR